MRVYVATRFVDRRKAAAVAGQLRTRGHMTTSRWHDFPTTDQDAEQIRRNPVVRQMVAREDYADLHAADAIVVIAHPELKGALMELATAYVLGKSCIVVGDPSVLTLMADRPGIRWVESVAQALDHLDTHIPRAA